MGFEPETNYFSCAADEPGEAAPANDDVTDAAETKDEVMPPNYRPDATVSKPTALDSLQAQGKLSGATDFSWTSKLLSKENGNAILVPLVLISFIPYFLPPGVLPPEVMALWGRQ